MSAQPKAANDIRDKVWSMPLDEIDVSDPNLFRDDTIGYYFERLRDESPIHKSSTERFGDFWSITRHDDIMAADIDHKTFSSEPAITIRDVPEDIKRNVLEL